MFSRYNSSPQGHVALPSPSCFWRVGRVGSVVMGIWGLSHPLQISRSHISEHPPLGSAQRLRSSHLQSANIFLGENKTDRPVTVNTGGTNATCREDFPTAPHVKPSAFLYSAFKGLKMLSSKNSRSAVSILIIKRFHKVIWL